MKYTDRELDRLLEKLIASTRSPRGKFSAAASYQILEKRLPRPALRLFSLRTLSAVAAIALLCFIGWNTYCYLKPAENFPLGERVDAISFSSNRSSSRSVYFIVYFVIFSPAG